MKLNQEKKYDLNVIKEIAVTDSFLNLDDDIRGCQVQTFEECATKIYQTKLLNNCQCLPFQIRMTDDVS